MTNLRYFVDKLVSLFTEYIEADPTHMPQQVLAIKEIVEDFFGVDNVELQITQIFGDGLWSELFSSISFGALCRQCGVPTSESLWNEDDLADPAYDIIYRKNGAFLDKFINDVDVQTLLRSTKLPLFSILIKFENITVTNEQDLSTVINEIFARFSISPIGRIVGKPYWIRTVYTYEHYNSHYSHSHLPWSSLSTETGSCWQHPCLGRGPITMTIHSLQEEFNIDMWPLLCRELDVCIRTESLAGGPYKFIREITPLTISSTEVFDIGAVTDSCPLCKHTMEVILTKTLKEGKLRWVYRSGHYEPANDFCELSALFTQAFLDYYMETGPVTEHTADELLSLGTLYLGYFTPQGSIKRIIVPECSYDGRTFPTGFSFKGTPVSCVILPYSPFKDVDHNKTMLLLDLKTVSLLHKLLILLANSVWK